ncbi:alpha-mannosidase 2-like [Tubulanus polymorphus]|uniref:alpha-mannosidase 2-like n=1 Tax=Tubulanus polymorphus TaxID=672921 RepID=UPI003DA4F7A6
MKFSHRIASLAFLLIVLLIVYIFHDKFVFERRNNLRRSKLVESHFGPIKGHAPIIKDRKSECVFGQKSEPIGGLNTHYILERVNDEVASHPRDPRVLLVGPKQKPVVNNATKLKVFVIPHSHTDPGWIRTIDDYYQEQTKPILDNLVQQMHIYKNMTFIWGETVFLAMWWNDIDEKTKSRFKSLIKEGRLEIVNGGWVAPDEASTTFTSFIDVMIEGHQWVMKNLGVRPKVNWSPDPFGYSATVPYLLNRAGVRNMVVLRVHEDVKDMLRERQNLEFQWRQIWDSKGDSQTLCHMMPYMLYSVKYSCGPTPFICLMFDFRKVNGEYTESMATTITPENVKLYSNRLVDQFRRKAENYKANVIFMPLGDDFRYDRPEEWSQQYTNFMKLMQYINARPSLNIEVHFGTLTDYFNVLHERIESNQLLEKSKIPILSGDFFPYTDREADYWTGYFTTRPFYKQLARELESNVRDAEILNSLAVAYSSVHEKIFTSEIHNAQRLTSCRENLALFQHHDAITGTSKPETIDDYLLKLWEAKGLSNAVKITSASFLLSNGEQQEEEGTRKIESSGLFLDIDDARGVDDPFPGQKSVFITSLGTNVFFFNSVAKKRQEIVRLQIVSRNLNILVVDSFSKPVKSQISPIWVESEILPVSETEYELIFQVEIEALGFSRYTIRCFENEPPVGNLAKISSILTNKKKAKYRNLGAFTLHKINPNDELVLENNFILASFSPKTGLLQSITTKRDGLLTLVKIQFLTYISQGSGAYLFYPMGPAENLDFYRTPEIRVISGNVRTEIHVVYPALKHVVRIIHSPILQSEALEIRNFIDIGNENRKVSINDKEIIMRLTTNIDNEQIFYTDMNGFQMMKRKYLKHLHSRGNYYPMTSMMYIEDVSTRLSILAGQSHGVASLEKGWMEVMLDRKLMYDDNRGLGEGVYDNQLTLSKFILLLERHESRAPQNRMPTISHPSLLAHSLQNALQHPIVNFIQMMTARSFRASFSPLKVALPCDINLLHLKTLRNYGTGINGIVFLLNRIGYECNYPLGNMNCKTSLGRVDLKTLFTDIKISEINEMTISLMYEKRVLAVDQVLHLDPMEIAMYLMKI